MIGINMFIQVINLDRSPERLLEIETDLNKVGWEYSRVRAIQPDLNYISNTELYNKSKTNYLFGRDLSRGEIGCFSSHLTALKRLVSQKDDIGLILEDDAKIDTLSPIGVFEISSKLEAFDPDWMCVNLCYTQNLRRRRCFNISNNLVFRAYQFPLLTAAILWNRASAKKFIDWCYQVGVYAPFDNQLRDWVALGNNGYSCDAPVIGIRVFPSTIVEQKSRSEGDRTLKPKNKFTRYELRQKVPLYWRSCLSYFLKQ